MINVRLVIAIIFLISISAFTGSPLQAQNSTLLVDGNCTLFDAIESINLQAAQGNCNWNAGIDTIILDVNVYITEEQVSDDTAFLITQPMTIRAGEGNTIAGDNSDFRLFAIDVPGYSEGLTLQGITITGGRPDVPSIGIADVGTGLNAYVYETYDFSGGGIACSQGALNLIDSTITANTVQMPSGVSDVFAYGGGVFVLNCSLSIINSTISNNEVLASSVADGVPCCDTDARSALGGGLYASIGKNVTIEIEGSVITNNLAKGGNPNGSAYGGGIWIDFNEQDSLQPIVSITNSKITDNEAISGYDTASAQYYGSAVGGGYGNEIVGYGIHETVFERVTVDGNRIVGEAAYGGGIAAIRYDTFVIESTVSNNTVEGSVYAYGGGIYTDSSLSGGVHSNGGSVNTFGSAMDVLIFIENSTLSGNITIGSLKNMGGGVYSSDRLSINHSTLMNNTAYRAPEVLAGYPNFEITNSIIVSLNPLSDCASGTSGSNNLTTSGDSSCPSTGTINPGTDIDPVLADNDGPTWTHALLDSPSNPAVNQSPQCGLIIDQRSYERDVNCDIGAFELIAGEITPTPSPTVTWSATPTATDIPTDTPTLTVTSSPTDTASLEPSIVPSEPPTDTQVPTLTDTATIAASDTPSEEPTEVASVTGTASPTQLSTVTPTLMPSVTLTATTSPTLQVGALCNGPDLDVKIFSGDGPFIITASAGVNLPVSGVGLGTTTIAGPEKWDNLTVIETSGNYESVNLGQFKCFPVGRPVQLAPTHRAVLNNAFPQFSWQPFSSASNYRVWVFDDPDLSQRTLDIRENSGGALEMNLSQPLAPGRYFWRMRARVNRLWSRWSTRWMFRID